MTCNIYSININGLRSHNKQHYIKNFISDNKVDILCLQETHINNRKSANIIERFISLDFKYIWSFGHGQSCGVCIIFINSAIDVPKFQIDFDGRFIYTDIVFNENNLRLCNIYAPNTPGERTEFFNSISEHFVSSNTLIICGDFNFVENEKLDKLSDAKRLFCSCSAFTSLKKKFNLFDTFRKLHSDLIKYSWQKNKTACRLDRFYVMSSFTNNVNTCNYIPCPVSDHDFVYINFNLGDSVSMGKSYWKINNSILKDGDFVTSFKFYWKIISRTNCITLDWWDEMKVLIKDFCVDFSKVKNRELYCEQRNLHKLYASTSDLNEREFIKNRLKILLEHTIEGARIRSKARNITFNENMSMYYHDVEFKNNKKKMIRHIVDNNIEKTNTNDILNSFRYFYKTLYTSETIDMSLKDEFLNNLPQVSEDDNLKLSCKITETEIFNALKQMDNTKTPGSDGLSSLFYLTFFDIFGPILCTIYNIAFDAGFMSDTQKLSYISLICKDPQNSHLMKNYRPISLLNVDRKILSKIITNRLIDVLPSIIGISQTCSVKGRSIFDNVHLLRNIFDYVEQKNLSACFINLDQEKAFDRVEWSYMFSVLESFGFGPSFISWIKVLYKDVASSVIVNGFISKEFNLERSVRQGCSLSPLLYILCLEPLAFKIQNDIIIKGLVFLVGNFILKCLFMQTITLQF